MNILGTVKKLIEPLSLSRREFSAGSFKKRPELCIKLQSKAKTSKLLKSKIIEPNDRERTSIDDFRKSRRILKKSDHDRGIERNSWSQTLKSFLKVNIKTNEILDPSSDKIAVVSNQPHAEMRSERRSSSYTRIYSTTRLLNVRSIVKNTDSKPHSDENYEPSKTQTIKEASESKEMTKCNKTSDTKAVLANEESETLNGIMRPYIYAKVTRRSLYNKLKL